MLNYRQEFGRIFGCLAVLASCFVNARLERKKSDTGTCPGRGSAAHFTMVVFSPPKKHYISEKTRKKVEHHHSHLAILSVADDIGLAVVDIV
jgi:hypothetical protein